MTVESPVVSPDLRFWSIVAKAAIVHTATYFIMGLIALYLFDYATAFTQGAEAAYMRPTTDPWVAAGPLFQPIRGLLFGIVFYLLRNVLFRTPRGWLIAWAMLAILGIINPFGAAPGSIEGAIYLSTPLATQLGLGLIEVYSQSLLLAAGTFYWVRNAGNRWFVWGASIIAGLAVAASLAGILLGSPAG